jgi:hypothetical protein
MLLSTSRKVLKLIESSQWAAWILQLENKLDSMKIWELADPNSTKEPLPEPIQPAELNIENYKASASHADRANRQLPLVNPSDLSEVGSVAYTADMNYYKTRVQAYQLRLHKFERQEAAIKKATAFIHETVSEHLAANCLVRKGSLRTWITNLQKVVGMDKKELVRRARTRYQNALKGFTNPVKWEAWLQAYDEAALTNMRPRVHWESRRNKYCSRLFQPH